MDDTHIVKISKYLSKHLRHQPERLELTLATGGWVEVADLLIALGSHGMRVTREELEQVVAENNKQRFSFDETGRLIRANQGHSVEVDLQLEAVKPPDALYHGAGHRAIEIIKREGLHKMNRHHVHLSVDTGTARAVGARHGKPVILVVNSAKMFTDGYQFYCSENGVWLTDSVPPTYLREAGDV